MVTSDARTPRCWFCNEPLEVSQVLGLGILRSRSEARGGPYRMFPCPSCHRSNLCEKTPRGRWFSSPPFRPNVLEYLFGRLLTANPEDFLQAVSWYRDNEERRRYFFERDGDRRYSAPGLIGRLWPGGGQEATRAAEDASSAPQGPGRGAPESGSRGPRRRRRETHGSATGDGGSRRTADERKAPYRRPVTPWEILGVPEDCGETEIRRAFHRLAVAYHPDKVHHLGEEFRLMAHRKFTALKRAYEELLNRSRHSDDDVGSSPP